MASLRKEEEIIKKAFAEAKKTCTEPYVLNFSNPLPGTQLTLHQVLMILGGCFSIINIAIACYLMGGHLRYWTKPREQKQYLRIIFFVIFLSLTTFFSLMFYDASGFIDPIGQYYEGFAIIAVYLLFTETIVSKNMNLSYTSFSDVKRAIMLSDPRYVNGEKSLSWLRRSWILVFQVAITRVATVIADEVLFSKKCPLSSQLQIGSTVVNAIQSFSTGLAVLGVIGLEERTRKSFLQHQRSVLKLISFKGIVALQALQIIIFTALAETKTFFPTPPYQVSYHDFAKGLPDILFLFELTIVTVMFLWSFEFGAYRVEFESGDSIKANPTAAFASMFSPRDYVKGLISGCKSNKDHHSAASVAGLSDKAGETDAEGLEV